MSAAPSTDPEPARAVANVGPLPLSRYRGPWSHLPGALLPMLLLVPLTLLGLFVSPRLSEAGMELVGGLIAVGFVALVLTGPLRWRRRQAREAATLHLRGATLYFRAAGGPERHAPARTLRPRAFRYRSYARYGGGGVHTSAAFELPLSDGSPLRVAVLGAAPRAREEIAPVDYTMSAEHWRALAAALDTAGHED